MNDGWTNNRLVCTILEKLCGCFVGLAYYQGKDIVFRFIIEYSIA
jgi:hypothetical protein